RESATIRNNARTARAAAWRRSREGMSAGRLIPDAEVRGYERHRRLIPERTVRRPHDMVTDVLIRIQWRLARGQMPAHPGQWQPEHEDQSTRNQGQAERPDRPGLREPTQDARSSRQASLALQPQV